MEATKGEHFHKKLIMFQLSSDEEGEYSYRDVPRTRLFGTAVAILIHFRRDFRAQSSDFFILVRSYVWYFANSSCTLNRFGSGEWQFYYLANHYLVRVSIPLYSKNNSPH